ncbi:MAG: hypothetical protein PVH25_03645 [Burkholderiales bacterium]|jgi:hypothetical protein
MDWERFRQEVNSDAVIARRGAGSSFRVLLGWGEERFLITVRDAAIVAVDSGALVMPQCDFALTGTAAAWERFSTVQPAPCEQDIFAFFRSGEIVLSGDTRKFYAHLMCLKLILLHLRSQG